jgi:23S rRNA pseudouridine2604 synthase
MIVETNNESIRLDKRLASQIPCSRSEAAQYIECGFVKVDGEVVEEPGFRVLAEQQVELMPEANLAAVDPVTILLHKPAEMDIDACLKLLTSDNHAADDHSGIHFIKRHLKDLELTDTLGMQSSGLLIYTQDFRIARKLIKDAASVEQEYIVETAGDIAEDGLQQLNKGIQQNGKLMPVKVSWQSDHKLRFAFKGVQRGQVADMCEKVGLEVLAMKRIRIGRIPMSSLAQGKWRYLTGYEKF